MSYPARAKGLGKYDISTIMHLVRLGFKAYQALLVIFMPNPLYTYILNINYLFFGGFMAYQAF